MKSLPANENPYPEPQPYDIEDALNRVEGDIELFDEIVEIFLDECPKMMAEIQASIELGDCTSIQRSAHAFKGAVGNMSAHKAHELSFKLETMGREENIEDIDRTYGELQSEVGRLEEALSTRENLLAA